MYIYHIYIYTFTPAEYSYHMVQNCQTVSLESERGRERVSFLYFGGLQGHQLHLADFA